MAVRVCACVSTIASEQIESVVDFFAPFDHVDLLLDFETLQTVELRFVRLKLCVKLVFERNDGPLVGVGGGRDGVTLEDADAAGLIAHGQILARLVELDSGHEIVCDGRESSEQCGAM